MRKKTAAARTPRGRRGRGGGGGRSGVAGACQYIWRNKYLYLLMLPGLILLLIFKYAPMYGILMAFKDFSFRDGILGSPWNHFAHFRRLFTSPDFYNVFKNSIVLNLLKIVFCFPIPIMLAIMLNEIRFRRFKKVTQTMVYLPYFISWVVLVSITTNLLSTNGGLVNELLKSLGMDPVMFLGKSEWFRPLIVITSVWRETGWNTIVYLAALTAIDQSLYEAAMVDGASHLQRIIHITLPGIAATIVVLLILTVGKSMDNGFEQIFLFQNPVNMQVSDVFETYTYRVGMVMGEFAYATAVGLFKSAVGFILVVGSNKIANLLGQKGIY